ncbi:homoserine dehydrogenase [Desulfobaculum bizertense DSM 18034]|uniref:Homoserine dehydrogenase n=1 Tax=Desulfobaculum bizertense DSM 18034 TaxID=1121442 RepID=A0A1T4VJP0_9BACT|nr:homoserine dehydrogenase [Desulfobaculum bizertense DSM 18034]
MINKTVINIGVAGFGTVGQGLADVIEKNHDLIVRRTGREIRIKSVLIRSEHRRAEVQAIGAEAVTDYRQLITDPDIDVVVELTGGIAFPKQLIADAINAGKHVVTANKALLAEDGMGLFALAAKKGVHLGFEASVAGGIPVVGPLRDSLAGNGVHKILGILNGTANYILTEMTDKGLDFQTALNDATEKGYAEADPTLDIEGIDTAHKLALLIRLAFGCNYPFDKLPVTGITVVTPMDISFAKEFGFRIKLLAQSRLIDGKVEAGVYPALVPEDNLLASVNGAFNAIRLAGNAGPVVLHGKGAGALPTGSAVLADIMAIARAAEPNNLGFVGVELPEAEQIDLDDAVSLHYLRFTAHDHPGVLRDIAGVLAERGISIQQATQKSALPDGGVPLVFLTHEAKACDIHYSMQKIDQMGLTVDRTMHLRIL